MVQLVVSDGTFASSPDLCTVSANTPPIANAGPDQLVAIGSVVQLNGAASTDPDGSSDAVGRPSSSNTNLTYQWSFVSRPSGSTATLSNASAVNPTFIADLEGTFVVRLTVSDGLATSQPDEVTVTSTSQVLTQLFMDYVNSKSILANTQRASGMVTLTFYGSGGSRDWEAVLGNKLDGNSYGVTLWLHAGTAAGQTGTFTAAIIAVHGGIETQLASTVFTVPFDPSFYVRYTADLSGLTGGVAGDKIILRVTTAGVSDSRIRYGSGILDSGIKVPGTVTVSPAPAPAGAPGQLDALGTERVGIERSDHPTVRYTGG